MAESYENGLYKSSSHVGNLKLGTVEKDASGGFGSFEEEPMRGYQVLQKLLETEQFHSVLDVGAGGRIRKCLQTRVN
jgi:hypothetical protein